MPPCPALVQAAIAPTDSAPLPLLAARNKHVLRAGDGPARWRSGPSITIYLDDLLRAGTTSWRARGIWLSLQILRRGRSMSRRTTPRGLFRRSVAAKWSRSGCFFSCLWASAGARYRTAHQVQRVALSVRNEIRGSGWTQAARLAIEPGWCAMHGESHDRRLSS